MEDVLIVGAGPAGSTAALVLARAGVRVCLIDRATFPRNKLCGDTVNPGTIAVLRRLDVAAAVEERGLPVHGMRVTGPNGAVIEGRYPDRSVGRSLLRRDFDWILLQAAIGAGAQFEPGVRIAGCGIDSGRLTSVGVSPSCRTFTAPVTIAADGRHSFLAFRLAMARHPPRPRRWAIGAYFSDVTDVGDVGEMHIRRDRYVGVAPMPGGLANVCIVTTPRPLGAPLRKPREFMLRTLAEDPVLSDRFATSRCVTVPVVLGPLAVDGTGRSLDGLLVTGDAAGFVDPMTGDGLHFAIRGGELAAAAALDALEHGWSGVHARHAAARHAAFGAKWRFNRALRALVDTPRAVSGAASAARIAPAIVRALIRKAGDCDRS